MFKDIYNSFYESIIYDGRYKYIFEGLFNTLIIALFACLIGVFIGILIAIIRHNHDTNGKLKILNKVVTWYVNVIRGTPVLLQLMIIYYVIFKSVDISIVIVGIVAFGLNSGAYVSEIIRSGINSIDTLIKETSAGAYIGIMELTKASDIIASRTYDYFFPLIIIALIYLVITLGLTKLVNKMEVKLDAKC